MWSRDGTGGRTHQSFAIPVGCADQIDALDEAVKSVTFEHRRIVKCLYSHEWVETFYPRFRCVNSL